MEDGFINTTDEELEKIWKDKGNLNFSPKYIESVQQEMLDRGLHILPKTPEESKAEEHARRIRAEIDRARKWHDNFRMGGRFVIGVVVLSVLILDERYWKLPWAKLWELLLVLGYALASVLCFIEFSFRGLRDKFRGTMFFLFYWVLSITAMSLGTVPVQLYNNLPKYQDFILVCLYVPLTVVLAKISDHMFYKWDHEKKNEDYPV